MTEERYHGAPPKQWDGGPLASQNCTPASLAAAADEASGGRIKKTASQARALVAPSQEQNPMTPGWSLRDADVAAARLGIELWVGDPATGWAGVERAHDEGRAVLVQGDSDMFADRVSGGFNGDHCVVICPRVHSDGRWMVGDPLLNAWRWEGRRTLRLYAEKYAGAGRARYAYTAPVPLLREPDVVGQPPGDEEEPMQPLTITDRTVVTLDVAVGAQLYRPDLTPQVKVSRVGDAYSPFATRIGSTDYRAVYISTGGVLMLLLARVADCSDVRPYVDAAVKAALAEGREEFRVEVVKALEAIP